MPGVPTLPKGELIAAYPTYLEAQNAVDHLSDEAFPVQHVTIVGTDLRMVERVTGRLTYARVALAGLASGAWFGLFVGLLLSIFSTGDGTALPILPAIGIGAAFGMLFSVISYSLTGGKRDFTSSSQIVATSYAVLCETEHAHRARGLLGKLDGGRPGPVPTTPVAQPVASPTEPPTDVAGAPMPPAQPPSPHGDPVRDTLPGARPEDRPQG
jgi:hypothetical protein